MEYRFRLWDNANKKMIPPSVEVKAFGQTVILPEGVQYFINRGAGRYITELGTVFEYTDGTVNTVTPKDCKLLGCFGFRDAYGYAIYDGDVLSYHDNNEVKYVLVYFSTLKQYVGLSVASMPIDEFLDWRLDAKVVGNIYENPELKDKIE